MSIREWGLEKSEVEALRRWEAFSEEGGGYSALQRTRVRF